MHPSIDSNFSDIFRDYSHASGLIDIYASIPLREVNFIVSIPLEYYSIPSEPGNIADRSGTEIGNIYVGIQSNKGMNSDGGWRLGIGMYLPTAKETLYVGKLTDLMNINKVTHEMATISIDYGYRKIMDNGFTIGLEFNPRVYMPYSEIRDSRGPELYFHYGGMIGYNFEKVVILTEVLSRYLATEKTYNRSFEVVTFGAQLKNYRIQPGMFFQIPLDKDFGDLVNYVFGMKMEYSIR
ncbi:hypothetical protein ACFL7D_01665 [candidate division KSB1 bacterium]